jgi:hypothetical protein
LLRGLLAPAAPLGRLRFWLRDWLWFRGRFLGGGLELLQGPNLDRQGRTQTAQGAGGFVLGEVLLRAAEIQGFVERGEVHVIVSWVRHKKRVAARSQPPVNNHPSREVRARGVFVLFYSTLLGSNPTLKMYIYE